MSVVRSNTVWRRGTSIALVGTLALVGACATTAQAVVTTFDSGTEGWSVSGRDTVSNTGGNPGANMDVEVLEVFGAEIRNDSNAAFLGDLTRYGSSLRFSVDTVFTSIQAIPSGQELTRDLVVELVDYNPPGSNYPYVSVWYNLGEVGSHLPDWRTLGVTVDNVNSSTLPAGWGGTGDEDPVTFEPRLPPERTFASVLQSVDEIRFTTMVPGFFYAFHSYVMKVDNPGITAVPEPASALAAGGVLGAMALRRGRRS